MVKPSEVLKRKYNLYTGKDAETVEDIMKATGLGATTVKKHCSRMVESKEWQRVFIKVNDKIKPAYLVKK